MSRVSRSARKARRVRRVRAVARARMRLASRSSRAARMRLARRSRPAARTHRMRRAASQAGTARSKVTRRVSHRDNASRRVSATRRHAVRRPGSPRPLESRRRVSPQGRGRTSRQVASPPGSASHRRVSRPLGNLRHLGSLRARVSRRLGSQLLASRPHPVSRSLVSPPGRKTLRHPTTRHRRKSPHGRRSRLWCGPPRRRRTIDATSR